MPPPANPSAREHYVYVIHANEHPFYVGHGRSSRLSDRPVYIDRLVRLHPERHYYKWTSHGIAVADLWDAGVDVYFDQLSEGLTKWEAAAQEHQLIRDLIADGFCLSNDVGNPGGKSPAEVVVAVLRNDRHWQPLRDHRPINRYSRRIR